jgi:hypothetical protein
VKDSRIFIHVGLPKTASTYLQNSVFPRLKNVAYIGRPYTQENYAFNTLQYADKSFYTSSTIRKELERIENEIARGSPILISDELFSGFAFYNFLNRGIIAERLSEIVPHAEIILFLRGQGDLILSLYNQFVKMGWVDTHLDESFLHRPGKGFSLKEWIGGKRDWNSNNRFINHRSAFTPECFRYSKLHSLYNDLFKKVHVFLYEDFKKDSKACLSQLGSILSTEFPSDLTLDGETRIAVLNKRFPSRQLRAQLMRNRLSHILPKPHSRTGQWLAKVASRIAPDNEENNRAHVLSMLKERDIFTDNYTLNETLHLGMENYPEQYFPENI